MKKSNQRILREKARRIRFLLLDVDGVMTDGTIYLDSSGREIKAFNVYDGTGIYQLQQAGISVGMMTGRFSEAVTSRARELGIMELHQNVEDKIKVYEDLLKKYGLDDDEMAYIGDDVIDFPVLRRVGLSIAVANAMPVLKKHADWVTRKSGGHGAIREVTDFLLTSKSR